MLQTYVFFKTDHNGKVMTHRGIKPTKSNMLNVLTKIGYRLADAKKHYEQGSYKDTIFALPVNN